LPDKPVVLEVLEVAVVIVVIVERGAELPEELEEPPPEDLPPTLEELEEPSPEGTPTPQQPLFTQCR
jgi:hypothetical protein